MNYVLRPTQLKEVEKHKERNVAAQILSVILRKDRNKGGFEGIETNHEHLRNNISFLVNFWSTHENIRYLWKMWLILFGRPLIDGKFLKINKDIILI